MCHCEYLDACDDLSPAIERKWDISDSEVDIVWMPRVGKLGLFQV